MPKRKQKVAPVVPSAGTEREAEVESKAAPERASSSQPRSSSVRHCACTWGRRM